MSIHHLFLEEGVYEENTSPATKKLESRREAWFSLLAETQVNRLLLPNPYSFLRGGAGEPFFGLQRTVPPQIILFSFQYFLLVCCIMLDNVV